MSEAAHEKLRRLVRPYMFGPRGTTQAIYGVPLTALTREEALAVIRWVWDNPGVINPPNFKEGVS